MKAQVTIEIPDGWELAESETRRVNEGEWFLNAVNVPEIWCRNHPTKSKRPILRKARWTPKEGETFYYVSTRNVICDKWREASFDLALYDAYNVWRTKEQAEEALRRRNELFAQMHKEDTP